MLELRVIPVKNLSFACMYVCMYVCVNVHMTHKDISLPANIVQHTDMHQKWSLFRGCREASFYLILWKEDIERKFAECHVARPPVLAARQCGDCTYGVHTGIHKHTQRIYTNMNTNTHTHTHISSIHTHIHMQHVCWSTVELGNSLFVCVCVCVSVHLRYHWS
jgi:hypothetical protein